MPASAAGVKHPSSTSGAQTQATTMNGDRVQLGVRMEKHMVKVLKGIARIEEKRVFQAAAELLCCL